MISYSAVSGATASITSAIHMSSPALLVAPRIRHSTYVEGVAMMHPPPNTATMHDPRHTAKVICTDGIEVGRVDDVNRISRGGWLVTWDQTDSLTERALSKMPANLIRLLVSGDPGVQAQGIELAHSLYTDIIKRHAAQWLASRIKPCTINYSPRYGQADYSQPHELRRSMGPWVDMDQRVAQRFMRIDDD